MSQLGLQLQREALDRSRQGRQAAIQQVREWLLNELHREEYLSGGELPAPLTADDVQDAVDVVFGEMKERRWTANILRGWPMVRCTDQYVTSRRPQNHARKIPIWVWV